MTARFLIAHPDPAIAGAVGAGLQAKHYHVTLARDGLDAIDRALDEKPDALVLGVDLPGLTGLDLVRALRSLEPTRRIPVLFLTEDDAQASAVTRAALPFVNLLTGPLDSQRLNEQIDRLLHARVPRAGEPDEHLAAISDPLTGLYARHYLLHRLTYEAARAARYHTALACALFGLDNLEALVRTHGRAAADRVLLELANIFRTSARVADIIGRAGEGEFLMIAPHTDARGARHSAERLLGLMCDHHFDLPDHVPVKISVGVAGAPGTSLADNLALFARAEGALRQAREGGESISAG